MNSVTSGNKCSLTNQSIRPDTYSLYPYPLLLWLHLCGIEFRLKYNGSLENTLNSLTNFFLVHWSNKTQVKFKYLYFPTSNQLTTAEKKEEREGIEGGRKWSDDVWTFKQRKGKEKRSREQEKESRKEAGQEGREFAWGHTVNRGQDLMNKITGDMAGFSSAKGLTLLDIHPKDAQSYHKDTWSTMFIASLFVMARTWKKSRCSSTEELIRKMWHIYSAVKNNGIMSFEGKWMELEKIIPSEVIQIQKDKHGMYSLISGY